MSPKHTHASRNTEVLVERFFELLVNGERDACRQMVQEQFDQGVGANRILMDLFWPVHETLERLHRADQLSLLSYNFATRALRALVDQVSARLERAASNGRMIFAVSGPSHAEELGGQMASDLLEAGGFTVYYAGGGIPADEVLSRVQETQPAYLVMFCNAASDLPGIRGIVDTIREIGAASGTQIVVGGGVFNRAEGLAEEIGIDLAARTPMECVELLCDDAVSKRMTAPTKKRSRAAA